jgi:hypothetical protein
MNLRRKEDETVDIDTAPVFSWFQVNTDLSKWHNVGVNRKDGDVEIMYGYHAGMKQVTGYIRFRDTEGDEHVGLERADFEAAYRQEVERQTAAGEDLNSLVKRLNVASEVMNRLWGPTHYPLWVSRDQEDQVREHLMGTRPWNGGSSTRSSTFRSSGPSRSGTTA